MPAVPSLVPVESERRIPVADGVSLVVSVWSSGSPPPFLLVHGLSSNRRTWDAVARRLQEHGHPVAAVDLRGHGQSDKPDDGYDFATLTADLRAVITALGFERPVVAGQSTGGNLAVELAHRAPESIAGAVGVDGGALQLQDRFPQWEECEKALAPPQFDGMTVQTFVQSLLRHHPDWSDEGVAATLANLEVRPDATVRPWLTRERHLRLLRALWEHRPSELLPRLTVPLLLVSAGKDNGNSAESGPNVQVEWMAGDHDLHVHRPEALADRIEKLFPFS